MPSEETVTKSPDLAEEATDRVVLTFKFEARVPRVSLFELRDHFTAVLRGTAFAPLSKVGVSLYDPNEDDARPAGLRFENVSATPPPPAPESTPAKGAGDPVQGDPAPWIPTLEGAVAEWDAALKQATRYATLGNLEMATGWFQIAALRFQAVRWLKAGAASGPVLVEFTRRFPGGQEQKGSVQCDTVEDARTLGASIAGTPSSSSIVVDVRLRYASGAVEPLNGGVA